MKGKKKIILIVIASVTSIFVGLLLLGVLQALFTDTQRILYFDKSYEGQVVDAETNKSIEGAIVVALWDLTMMPSEGFGGYANIAVKTTDKYGRFKIPAWIKFKPLNFNSVVDELSPRIVIYKPGFKVKHSHKLERAGFPDSYEKTEEEKRQASEKHSLTPAKLARVYTDEERLENYDSFEFQTRFPNEFFSKKQSIIIFNIIGPELHRLPDANKRKKALIRSYDMLRKHWTGGQ